MMPTGGTKGPARSAERRLVIANRGEIARRVLRAGRERGYLVAVISSPEDADAPVRREADAVLEVGSFLDIPAIVEAARAWGAHLLHPGYGFLSENAAFAAAVEDAGIAFVGPTPENMRAMGGKESAKAFASQLGVPTLGALLSHELASTPQEEWEDLLLARDIRSPFLVKASGGGGGKGMRIVERFEDLPAAIHRASQEALAGFGDATVFVERYLAQPRHVEVQVFGDGRGGGVFLGERECSLQRRHQKVLEEAPSPALDAALRERMGRASMALVERTLYRGAGTVEFLLVDSGEFFFLEMNTRLQVEHPVTEAVYGVDLVGAQLALAEGAWPEELGAPNVFRVPEPVGVSFEARILAENPRVEFLPTPGPLVRYVEPVDPRAAEGRARRAAGVRVDSGVAEGGRVNASFDSMIAKLVVHAPTRAAAALKLREALSCYVIHGCTTNVPFLLSIAEHPDFVAGRVSTAWIARELPRLNAPRLPRQLLEFFKGKAFRSALADALGGAGSIEARAGCGWLSSARRFADVGLPAGVDGSQVSRAGGGGVLFDVDTHARGPGAFLLGGQGVLEALVASVDHDEVPDSEGGSPCPDVREAASLAASLLERDDRGQAGVKAGSRAGWIPIFASRLSREKLAVSLYGEVVEVACPRWERPGSASGQAAVSELRAPMAGKILEIACANGMPLAAGDLAFVVESMKMQLEVRAPVDCVVEEILVQKGQILSGPDVLASLAGTGSKEGRNA
jgi:acetyl/propionyl-CoA carboxylase alpha subunit